jgi:hypothetical protein
MKANVLGGSLVRHLLPVVRVRSRLHGTDRKEDRDSSNQGQQFKQDRRHSILASRDTRADALPHRVGASTDDLYESFARMPIL